MPRDLPLSNGKLLVTFDGHYRIRDIYYPHIGSENHTAGHINRIGVWVDGEFAWLDNQAWERVQEYLPGTLVTNVRATSARLGLSLVCHDCVDFEQPILIRQIEISDLTGRPRQVRMMFHYDSYLYETEVGDTACYRPQSKALVFYKRERYLLGGGSVEDSIPAAEGTDPAEVPVRRTVEGIASWATGTKVIHHAEGTWRDAEDGQLERNSIAQGSVDGVIALHADVPAGGIGDRPPLALRGQVDEGRGGPLALRRGVPAGDPDAAHGGVLAGVGRQGGAKISAISRRRSSSCIKRSLLIVRSQIDASGAIIAANDTDAVEVARDHYSYMWPRDGALVAEALDNAGYREATRRFYTLVSKLVEPEGYVLHKYNPDGTLASSWHPWSDGEGNALLPIQEDESALLLYGLWVHYDQYTRCGVPASALPAPGPADRRLHGASTASRTRASRQPSHRSLGGAARDPCLDRGHRVGRAGGGGPLRRAVRRGRSGRALPRGGATRSATQP